MITTTHNVEGKDVIFTFPAPKPGFGEDNMYFLIDELERRGQELRKMKSIQDTNTAYAKAYLEQDNDMGVLSDENKALKQEIARLRQMIIEKDTEIARQGQFIRQTPPFVPRMSFIPSPPMLMPTREKHRQNEM